MLSERSFGFTSNGRMFFDSAWCHFVRSLTHVADRGSRVNNKYSVFYVPYDTV